VSSRACVAVALVAAATVAITGQSSLDARRAATGDVDASQERATFRTSLDLVSVAVVVRGSDGRLVSGLRAADFEVMDCGTARPIVQFHQGGDADARLALLVDSSGSMVLGAKRERSRLATELLIAGLRKTDTASVFTFDKRVRRLTPFTHDPSELRTAVTSVQPFGATSIYDAIVGTIRTVMDDAPRARALLLLTDGDDTASVLSPGEAITAAAALDIPLYVLSVDDTREANGSGSAEAVGQAPVLTLKDLAVRTGGLAAEGTTIAQLSAVTRTILTELRHQYVLAVPADAEKGWHRLTVRVRRGRVQARSRDGYLVS
jgi:VWFA-related protein